jgi:signal transduction histidine kinase/ActR/RegA family two-component response regulator
LSEQPPPLEDRILVLAPTGRDATLTCDILGKAELAGLPCSDEAELCREIERGAAVAILTEEALHPWTVHALVGALGRQGAWSDLPLIVFTRDGRSGEAALETLGPIGNATILDRPVRVSTLISTVQAAMRARRRQYEVRDLLIRQAEADRRKDEFLAMLGHELRNPLAAIRNALWVLEQSGSPDGLRESPQPRRRSEARQREVIERQTHHLVRMVDDLLDVSRVTRGKISLQRETVDLERVVERCLSELGMARLAETHELTVSVRTEPVQVEGDPVRIEQVVCNLFHNAVKYTPRGGRIAITVEAEDGTAVLRVRDTGIGISEDMLGRIFEPFTQVESSRKRSEGGLGLGLPLVRSLVALHGGTVEAHSAGPGLGSEFLVRLPRLADSPEPLPVLSSSSRAVPAPIVSNSGPLQVLVVEDNLDGRESLRDLLELWGHEVELAGTGPEGIEKALALQPDVALIDIGLPGLDGNEVAQRIRTALGPERIALIAMTGYGQPEDRRRALQAGFDAYLVKPVDPADLKRLLAELPRSRSIRQLRN